MRFFEAVPVVIFLYCGALAPAARADITYDVQTYFTHAPADTPYQFTFTEPAFLSSTTTIPGADITLLTPPAPGCAVADATITAPDSSSPNILEDFSGSCGGAAS